MQKTSAAKSGQSLSAELDRALAREAATREILDLISQSRDDEAPVFDAILHRAADLCGAHAAALVIGRPGDAHQRMVAHYGISPATVGFYDRGEVPMNPEISLVARAIVTGKVVHIEDLMETDGYRNGFGVFVSYVRDSAIRTNMFAPLLTPSGGIGAFIIFRKEVRPYTPDEVAMAETFAAQAVIAIENARQFRELQTRLAQEAATGAILGVISQSRDDDQPVFEVIVKNAQILCNAPMAGMILARPGDSVQRLAAHHKLSDKTVEMFHSGAMHLDGNLSYAAKSILEGAVINLSDMGESELYKAGSPVVRAFVDEVGIRSVMFVPLMAGDVALGTLALFRYEVLPFEEQLVELVRTFAAQAVIAIENVRQFRELQTRLAREAATREILSVISQSRDDERPVFDVVLRKSAHLCGASMASLNIISEDRSHVVKVADWGDHASEELPAGTTFWQMESGNAPAVCVREGRIVHLHDMADTDLYRSGDAQRVMAVESLGIRTFLAVPLFSGDRTIGCISTYRHEVKPFAADEIALVETFAAQAVIAIENVRQFRELQTRLAREKASAEILEVISQSRDDDRPVFDVIVSSAARLCNAPMAWLVLSNDAQTEMTVAGYHGLGRRQIQIGDKFEIGREADTITGLGRAIVDARTTQDEDLALAPTYMKGARDTRQLVDIEGIRTRVSIPLVSGGKGIGAIVLSRREVAPFKADEIALVETFAAQAVIAIENVRQFRELQTRLEREAATRDILSVISQSRDDDAPVFDVIVRSAARLCNAQMAWLLLTAPASHAFVLAGYHGLSLRQIELGDIFEIQAEPDSITGVGRAIYGAQTVPEEDLAQTAHYLNDIGDMRMLVDVEGIRSRLCVPLISGGVGIGAIVLTRREVAPFTPDQIALVETFAAQAVIAIENVRQFRELQTRLAREAATREILEVISQSRDDDRPVFDVVLRKASELCRASLADLHIISEDRTHAVLAAEWGDLHSDMMPVGETVWQMDADNGVAICMREGRIVHIHDLADTDLYRSGERFRVIAVDEIGIRTFLAVPMFSGGRTVSCITIYRREVRPFTADEIALVETFAAQAVIAIENVRQFRELQARLAREAATREILEVISRNPDDDRPVFDVILRNVILLCGGDTSALLMGRRDDPRMTMAAWRDRDSTSSVMDDAMIIQMNNTEMLMDPNVHVSAQAIIEERNIHLLDVKQHPSYLAGEPSYVIMGDALRARSALVVPLIDARGALGTVHVHRREVRPFTDDEISLVETFAAQAVIAIENVRQFRELQTRLAREAATREILEVISRNPDDDRPVFDVILGNAIRLCGADTSSLTLGRRDDPRLKLVAWRDKASSSAVHDDAMIAKLNATDLAMDPAVHLSAQVIFEERKMQVLDVLQTEGYLSGEPSYVIHADTLGARTVLLIPLIDARGALGVVHVQRREVRAFSDDEIALLETFAAQAVIAIENVRQFKALEALNAELGDRVQDQVGEIERMGRLKRFLPAAVADTVISSGSEKMLSSHRALLGVLFCDIRGFTAFCETAEPEETIEVLQTYHEEMGKLINAHGAGVDHRMGDGIMVLFNDPIPCDDPAGDAVRLAMAMRERMTELCKGWKRLGHRLGFGLGVSLGYATVGMVGFEGRFDYTASGTAINLASRLCDEAQDGEILISPRTRLAVEGDFAVEPRGEISFKGIREPVEVFCVTGVTS